MKVIKKINNNVAICLDNNGKELIAFGNGIGFPKVPYEIHDLNKISRTYYGVSSNLMDLLNEIPEDIFEISAGIVDYAKTKIVNELNSNVVFTLADHIHFAIQRYEKNMKINIPFLYDLEHLYETELEIGRRSVVFINKKKGIHLPMNEAAGIALHFINAENMQRNKTNSLDDKKVIADITGMIEEQLKISINKRSFNYSRFVTHMQYLLKRQQGHTEIQSENKKMFDKLVKEFPEPYHCALHIREYIKQNLDWKLTDEELLYLILHINRLCSREDCNQ